MASALSRSTTATAKGFDTSAPVVDVTEDLRAGDNTVTVRVSSSLNNRLLARGYYDQVPDILTQTGRERAADADHRGTRLRPAGSGAARPRNLVMTPESYVTQRSQQMGADPREIRLELRLGSPSARVRVEAEYGLIRASNLFSSLVKSDENGIAWHRMLVIALVTAGNSAQCWVLQQGGR